MTMEENSSVRGRDEAAIEILRQLREKLFSGDISTARLAGFNLSWKQEDGLAILKEALFGDYSKTTKKAAAYGLRSMHGRMKQLGAEILRQGLNHRDRVTREACVKALALIKNKTSNKSGSGGKPKPGKSRIREIPHGKDTKPESVSRKRPPV